MKSIQIYNPQGYAYEAKWNGSVLFPITDSCERIANVMGEDCVRLVFKLPNKVVFDAFAYIVYNGQTFFLKEQYIPTPDGTFVEDSGEINTAYYSYDVKFVSVGNMFDKFICYRHVKVTNAGEWDEPEININGNLETLYVIIMGSIQQASNRLKAQYGQLYFADLLDTIVANGLDGNMPNTENVKLTANTNLLTFNFSGDNIANVCTTVANSFTNDDKKDTEWYIVENNGSLTLHFAKCVDVEYGVQYVSDYISNNNSADSFARPQKSGGLKKVEYSQAWSGITNVIVPYGSTRNMSYQAAKGIDEITQMQSTFGKRLRLIPNTSYNVKDKEGNEVIITTDSHGAIRNNYVDTGIEQVKFYDEIYPQGHFRVTSVETKNKRQDGEIVPEYTVSGIAIDSKGNEIQPAEGFYPISIEEGTTLSVRFEKGLLNGREFEIANKTRKDEGATTYSLKFTIVADGSIEDGTLIPSGNFIPREGDEFALFNMKMPEVYITAAQQELAQRAYDELVELQTSRPQVKCTTDPTSWDKPIALGYQFKVMSELFNSEESFISRVTSYSYKLTKPYDVQFTLASAIMQGTLSQMNDLISDVTHQAGGLEQRAINLSRRGWRDAAEMAEMVDSLAADMMLVGNEKYQFAFTAGIEIVNSNNQTTAIKIGEGTLQHTQDPYISDYTCQGWWSHGAVTLNNGHTENGSAALPSVPDTPFYLYAVVGQNSTDISFELQDQEQDGEAYLLLGILSSAFADNGTNYRVFNRTNGYTQISGGTITTEQIQDAGRNLIIDFQSNKPRIIARNGAEIIGNIKFKASDEMTAEEQLAALGIGVGNAQSTADAANTAITAEQAARQAAIAELQKQVAAEEEARTEAIAGLESVQSSLQAQIDGEVTSWFYDKAPVDTSDNILTNVEPMSEWLKNYTYANGVYALNSGARNDLVNHIGDTYTNMEEYKADDSGNTTTPLAGLSWRWCDATSVSPLPSKYITIKYKDNNGSDVTKKLHWHKIADSDAVKALQEAAKAQSTADGKSTIFSLTGSNKPTNYQKGDMWILQSDTIHTAGKKGDILNANADSATYVASHWTKEVSYIDESVAQQQAQQALDGLELGGENLVLESKGDSNKNIMAYNSSSSNEFQYSCTPVKSDTYGDELKISLSCSTQNKYYPDSYSYATSIWIQCKKDTIRGKKYTISFDARLMSESSNTNCTIYFRAAGTGYSTTQMGKAIIDKTKKRYSITVDSNVESDTNVYNYFTLFLDGTTTVYISNVKIEQGNKATGWSPAPEDVDSKADAIKAIADEAKENADDAIQNLANMSNDSILTPQEKGSVADEWACIQKEYAQNSTNKTAAWGSATVAEWTAYNNAYTTLQTYVSTLALADRTNNTTIVKSTFQTNFANYYSANVAFLNALSKKVAELEVAAMEIGGRNLLKNSNVLPIGQWGTSNATYTKGAEYATMKMNVAEVMSTAVSEANFLTDKKWKDKNICISVAVKSSKDIGLKVGIVIRNSSNVNISQNYYNAPYINVKAGEWTRIYSTYKCAIDADADNVHTIYLIIGSSTTCSIGDEFNIKDWKIEFGNKATDWTPAPEDVDAKVSALDYLKTALTDGSTEIAGGLTMTNVLMLKNLAGSVTAGMSGLTKHENKEDKVLMWGGGTYEEAYAAANNNTYNTGSGTITTLLKKDGTGKIGAFQIDKDTIKVVTDTQTTYITNKSIENAVGVQNTYDKAATKTTDSNSINSSEGERKSASYPSGGSKVIHTQTFYNVAAGKYLLTGEFTINSMSVGTTPVDPPSYAYSSLDLQNLYIEVWQNSKRVGYLYGNPNRQIVYEKTYQSEGNEEVLENSDTGYRGGFILPSNGNASKTITLSAGTITIRAVAEYDAYLETEGLASASYYIDFRYLYHLQGIEKYTVIANDGIAVISNSDSQFYINNDSDSLNVKMRGLPASSTGLVKGDLYTSNGYLRIVT